MVSQGSCRHTTRTPRQINRQRKIDATRAADTVVSPRLPVPPWRPPASPCLLGISPCLLGASFMPPGVSPRPTLQFLAAAFMSWAKTPVLFRAFSDAAGFSSKIDNTFSKLKESEDIMTEMGSVSDTIVGLLNVKRCSSPCSSSILKRLRLITCCKSRMISTRPI
jgi:hypothetical protein